MSSKLNELTPEQRKLLALRLKTRAAAAAPAPADTAAGGEYPVSFTQQRLWLLDRLEPGGAAYSLPSAHRFFAPLDPAVLERALDEVVRRHAVLRTRFALRQGEPVQVVAPHTPFRLPLVDLSRQPAEVREAELRRLAQEDADTPFVLDQGPLFRATLVRMGPADLALLTNMHHAVTDGWSMTLFWSEVGTLLSAFSEGHPSPLPPLPLTFGDYARRLRERLAGPALERLVEHWKARLAGAPLRLDLPFDRPRPALASGRGGTADRELPAGTAQAVQALATASDATPFMVLLAAFQVLLSRYARQDDLLVGTAIAGRTTPDVERLIGFFANTLVLRGDLSGDPPFHEALRRAREFTLDAFQHQEMPFERLVQELNPDRAGSAPPVVQVMFVLQNTPPAEPPADGDAEGGEVVRTERVGHEHATAAFDLTLTAWGWGDRLRTRLEYATDLFDRGTAERMLEQFQALLAGALSHPDTPVSALPLLSAAERGRFSASGVGDAVLPESTVPELLAAQAMERPDAVAVSFGDESVTYHELRGRVARLASRLRAAGAGPERVVAVVVEHSPDAVVAMLAAMESGGAYLPLDPAHPPDHLAFQLADSGAVAVLAQPHLAGRVPAGLPVLTTADEPGAELAEAERIHPAGAAYVLYTSGSTGTPKGVVVPHAQAVAHARAAARRYGLTAGDRVLLFAALTFDPSVEQVLGALAAGARLVVRDPALWGPAELAARARRAGLTVANLPAAYWTQVVGDEPSLSALRAQLRLMVVGGEAMGAEAARRWMRAPGAARLLNAYGPTESVVTASAFDLPDDFGAGGLPAATPIGGAMGGRALHVLDARLRPLPEGAPGELFIGGPVIARGYLRRPAATAERFIPDPYGAPGSRLYRTGDLVRRREGGALEFLGRIDQQLKVRGYRIEPGQVEHALREQPSVADAVVVARRDGPGDARLVAYVAPRGGARPEPAALREALARRMPAHLVPSAVVVLDALPLTPNGKVDRGALPAPDTFADAGDTGGLPRTPTEEVLAALWAGVLRADRVGPGDDFFALGGHSLLATQVVARVRDAFGVEVPLRVLFESSRLSAFAEQVDAAVRARAGAAAHPLERGAGTDRPLSFAQERLWFIDRLEPGNTVYNMGSAVRLTGALDVAALERALGEVVRRHETLRTRFALVNGAPVQRVESADGFALGVDDVSHLAEDEREDEARRRAAEWGRLPFDLERGPLFRVRLLRLDEQDHVLLVGMHHAVSDGWSMGVFWRELITLYHAFGDGQPSPLPGLPIQYADYAAWQRRWLSGQVLDRQVAWWRDHLGGAPALLELPADRPRPAVQSHRGASVAFQIPPRVADAVRALAREEGATLFMALLAAWNVLLSRWSGQDDVVVGTPVAGRTHRETEGLIGFFINTLAIRGDLSGDPAFRALLGRVREATLGAYAHQDLPFERLVEELQPARSLSHAPVYQVMLVLQNTPDGPTEGFRGLEIGGLDGASDEPAKVDLTLGVAESPGGGLNAALTYAADLFEPAMMERMAASFAVLLAAAVSEPDTPVSALPLMEDGDDAAPSLSDASAGGSMGGAVDGSVDGSIGTSMDGAVDRSLGGSVDESIEHPVDGLVAGPIRGSVDGSIDGFVDGAGDGSNHPAIDGADAWDVADSVIPELFAARANATPDALAVVAGDGDFSYGALRARAHSLAARLRAAGAGPERVVGVLAEHSADAVAAMLGVLGSGAAYLPLDPGHPAERLAFVLADSGAVAVVAQPHLAARLPSTPIPVLPVDGDDDARHVADSVRPSAGNAAYVLYTSGSTGAPRAVVVTHGQLAAHLRAVIPAYGLGPADRVLVFAALTFDPSVEQVLAGLLSGAALVMRDPEAWSPAELAERARVAGITYANLPTAYWNLVVADAPSLAALRARLRLCVVGGEAMQPEMARRWVAAPGSAALMNAYGPTEAAITATLWPVPAGFGDGVEAPARMPIGGAVGGRVARVLDARLRPVPAGVPGELYLGGPVIARGYLKRPGSTAERFIPDPFGPAGSRMYRTGDRARQRADGALEFLGRADEQVKVRGFRIEPGEVESALRGLPTLAAAAVLARADAAGERRLVAYVVPRPGQAPRADEVRDALRGRLPEYMVPSAVVVMDALPLTRNGKLDRGALPAPEAEAAVEHVAPRTATEARVASIWAGLLGLERVSARASFFDLGGHSLLATRVVARLRDELGVEVPLRALFRHPALHEFASRVDRLLRTGAADGGNRPRALPREGDAPLSFAQERLWFIDRLEPGNTIYNMGSAVRLTGALDVAALERALGEVVRRHETLRTRFALVNGAPVQRVESADEFALAVDDVSHLAEDEREDEARRRAAEWGRLPFDLERGPLFRVRLLRLDEQDHVLLVGMHHAVSDGWSMGVFWRELITLYHAFGDGQPSPLPGLPIQYADYAAWQRRWLSGQVLDRQVAWWRDHLGGAPALLELPADRPRPAVQSHRGASVAFQIPPRVADAVRALAREEGATLFMALLAAWNVLLSRWSGQDDVVVGTPVAGRTHRETEGLIGFFINTLAIRGDLSGDPAFRELLGRVREATLGAYAHQDLPFERLVEELQPARSLSHAPVYQVMLVLQNTPDGPTEGFRGLEIGGLGAEGGGIAKVDLSLGLVEWHDGSLRAGLEYATDLFDRETVERMAGHFATLLAAAAREPHLPASRLPLMGGGERDAVAAAGAARAAHPVADTLHRRFAAQAARTPDAIALTLEDTAVTYRELDARANRVAHHLVALGAGPDRLVGLCVERSVDTVAGILAILKAGAAYLPLDPVYPQDRLAYMVADSGVGVVLTTSDLADRLPESATLVRLDADGEALAAMPVTAPAERAGPESLAYVIYTSGSTGRPKGVQVTHANVSRLFAATDDWFSFGADDVWTLFHSYAFDFSVWEMWGALLYGGRLVVVPFLASREPEAFYALLERERVTVLNQTPSAFRQLMRVDEEAAAAGRARELALRYVVFGGEALDPATLREWVDRRGDSTPLLVNMYGITETTVHVTWRIIREADARAGSASPIGIPIPDLSVHLLDGRGQLLPAGIVGEMYVGGAGVARGYLGRPGLTAERFVPDPFGAHPGARLYRSGDLARRLADGSLEFFGRADDQVKVRGFRIELGEIESVLLDHPAVREAVVLARGAGDERRLVAWVVAAADVSPAALRAHLLGRLPEYMAPSAFVVVDALPLTRNGKLDRRALPEPEAADVSGSGYVAPRTATEELLAGVWADLLGAARVGADDGFFALGGHSLLATRVVSRVREAFGVELPVRAVFEHAVLSGQAAEIDRLRRAESGTEAPPIVPAPRDGDLPLSFAQERMWFVDQLEPGSPVYHMPFQYLLNGDLHVDALRRALTELVRRHEVLRTAFPRVDGIPVQRIFPPAEVDFPLVDVTHLAEEERGPEALRIARESAAAPFRLDAGPLFRASLVRVASDEHVLLMNLHHVISDGWSTGVLWSELSALYGAFARGEPSPLPGLSIQYADYAHWQRQWLRGEVLERELAYWRERLAGAPPLLELPVDRPRPAAQTHAGASESLRLPRGAADAVLALGRREGATLFMTLLAGFALVLSRLSGHDDVVIGTPIAGRTRGETERLIGLFLNSLALRTDLSGNISFRELLARVRETTLGAYAHQEVPFERILEEIQPERSLGHSPVFQVMLNLSNFDEGEMAMPGLDVRPIGGGGAPSSKFDMTLYAGETPDGVGLYLVYNPDLFGADRMRHLLAQLAAVLAAAARDASRPIGALSLVTEGAGVPDPALPLPAEAWHGAAHERFAARAAAAPGALALVDRNGAWSYGGLDAAANRLAHRLVADGVRPGEVVAIYAHRSAPLVRAMLGAWKAGAAFVMLDPAYPPARLADYVRVARPAGLLRIAEAGAVPHEVQAALAETVRSSIVLGAGNHADVDGLASLPAEAPDVVIGPDDAAYVAFTSGTTGAPKAITGTHRPLAHFFGWYAREFGLGADDRFTLLAGLAHDPLLRDVLAPLTSGGSLAIPDPARIGTPGWLADWMRHEAVTVAHLTPAMGQLLAATAQGTLPALRLACFGGETLSAEDARSMRALAPGAEVVNFYGATETPQAMAAYRVPGDPGAGAQPVGRGIEGAQLLVLTPAGALAGVGELGEIAIRTPYLSRGYANDPELTAARFVRNPFREDPADRMYRTGDLGRYRPDGAVQVAGRADQQTKVRGFRIEPAEIKAALRAHPAVREAVVLARGEGEHRVLVAWLTGSAPDTPPAQLREHLRRVLPEYMVPSAFVWMDALPLTPNGKLDRRALPDPRAAEARAEPGEPRTATETVLAGVWSALLGREGVGPADHFFALGGHSLLATRLSARVREALGVELPLRAVFEHPTLGALAAEVDRVAGTGAGAALPPIRPVPRGDTAPASFAQERMWFVDRLEPGGAVYLMPSLHHLAGEVDVAALRRAVAELVRRHETLRTALPEVDGVPVQRILPAGPVELPFTDLGGLPEAERGVMLARLANQNASTPFDVAGGPLFRASLVRLSEADHVLLVNVHHAVSDGWSNRVLITELTALYGAFSRGEPSPLAPLPVQYADYALWQRQWLHGPVLERQLAYWRGRLAGAPPLLELPTDRPRPAVQTHRGASAVLHVDREVADSARALARAESATLFMVLLAAFNLVLSRLSGQDDVVVGTPIAGRTRAEVEGLIGLFLNSLALRTDLSGDPPFRELLARVRETTLQAYAHQDVPFERVLEEAPPERSLSHTPVFQVMLNLLNFARGEASPGGVEVTAMGAGAQAASKFDMTLYVGEGDGGLALHLVYNADLFGAERMRHLLAQLASVLRQATDDASRRVGAFSLVTDEARPVLPDVGAALSAEWRGSVPALFRARAAASPHAVAVEDASERWTYAELNAAAGRVANRLRADGVAPGEVVAIWGHRSAALVRALLGTLSSGAAFLVLDPAYPAARLAEYVRIARPAAFLRIAAAGGVPHEVRAALDETVRGIITLGVRNGDDGDDVGAVDGLADVPAADADAEIGADSLAYLSFTSGTTGTPRAVMGRHGSLTHFTPWLAERFGLGAADRFSMLSGLAHDPLHRDVFTPLQLGASVVVPEADRIGSPGYLAAWARAAGVTVAHLTPAMGQVLTDVPADGARDALGPGLRLAFFVGDVLTRADVARLHRLAPGVQVVNYYGSTETQRAVGHFVVPRELDGVAKEAVPVGRGIPGVQLLVRAESGALAGVGEVGEIWLRSPHVALGYLGDPELTARRFVRNSWRDDAADVLYRTGDLGRYRPDGAVEVAGRADQQVKIRGFRVEPGEIEAVLRAHPGVRDVVVVARGEGDGRRLAAYLVADGEARDAEPLREHLRTGVPEYMVPSAVVFLDALPLTPNGKVNRAALPEPDVAEEVGSAPPRTATEEVLAAVWGGLLGREAIGRDDHFFSLGGHSLLATRVVARVREALGVELPLRAAFEHPTLAALAADIDRRARVGAPAEGPIVPTPRGDTAPASFAQERLWFVHRLEGGGAAWHIAAAYRLPMAVDVGVMEAAVTELVRRHETLRTALAEVDGAPVQRIHPAGPVRLPFSDLSSADEAARRPELARLAGENAGRPFDLERGPLFRAALVRVAPDEHVLLTCLHHAVGDGWSNGVLFRELTALYAAFARGEPSPLPPLPIQYADYALWQRQHPRAERLDAQVAFWRDALAGAPPRLALPTDRPRPPVQTHVGASERLSIPAGERARVAALGQREGATLFMVLLAAFNLVLSRLAGQDDVVVGTPIAGRTRAETEGLIGPFLNTLALRTDLSGNITFRELLRRVRETTLQAYAHQEVPFERVLQAVQPRRSLGHTPVFQVMLNLLNFGGGEANPEGVDATRLGGGARLSSKFDLTLYAGDGPDGLGLHCLYNPDLFGAERMRAFLAQVAAVLHQAANDPDQPISRISLAGDGALLAADADRVVRTAAGLPAGVGEVGEVWVRDGDAPRPSGELGRLNPDGSVDGLGPVDAWRAARDHAPRPPVSADGPRADGAAVRRMVRLWREVLGRADVGPDDDFFDLGGHSLLGVRLLAAVRRGFGRALPVAELFRASTPAALALAVERGDAPVARNLVPLREAGSRPPLFLVHPAGGTVSHFRALAAHLPDDQPVYALQATGVLGEAPPLRTVGDMAARYVDEIRRVQPAGPYVLGGWSAGGVIALEMAHRLRASANEVALVALLDTRPPDFLQERAVLDSVEMYRRFAASLAPADDRELAALADGLRELAEDDRPARLGAWITARGAALEAAELERIAGAVRVFEATARATREHHLSPYHGPVVLFCAEQGTAGEGWREAALPEKWRALGFTAVDAQPVPGTHASMVLPPNVEPLAEALSAALESIAAAV